MSGSDPVEPINLRRGVEVVGALFWADVPETEMRRGSACQRFASRSAVASLLTAASISFGA